MLPVRRRCRKCEVCLECSLLSFSAQLDWSRVDSAASSPRTIPPPNTPSPRLNLRLDSSLVSGDIQMKVGARRELVSSSLERSAVGLGSSTR